MYTSTPTSLKLQRKGAGSSGYDSPFTGGSARRSGRADAARADAARADASRFGSHTMMTPSSLTPSQFGRSSARGARRGQSYLDDPSGSGVTMMEWAEESIQDDDEGVSGKRRKLKATTGDSEGLVHWERARIPLDLNAADAVAIQCGGLWSKRGIVWAVTPTKLVLYPLFMNRTPPALEFPLPPSLRSMDHDEMPRINVSITEVSAGSRSAGCFAILLVSDVGLCRLWSNVSWPITSTVHATPVIPESVLDGYRDMSIEAEVEHAVDLCGTFVFANSSSIFQLRPEETDIEVHPFPSSSSSLGGALFSGIGRMLWWGGEDAQGEARGQNSSVVEKVVAMDGSSIAVLSHELIEVYRGRNGGQKSSIPVRMAELADCISGGVHLDDVSLVDAVFVKETGRLVLLAVWEEESRSSLAGAAVFAVDDLLSSPSLSERFCRVEFPESVNISPQLARLTVSAEGVAAYISGGDTIVPLNLNTMEHLSPIEAQSLIVGSGWTDSAEDDDMYSMSTGGIFLLRDQNVMTVSQPSLLLHTDRVYHEGSGLEQYERNLLRKILKQFRLKSVDIGRAAEILNRASGVPGSERQVRLNKAALEMSNVILTERAGPDARWADASSSKPHSAMTMWHVKKQLQAREREHIWLSRVLRLSWLRQCPNERWQLLDNQARITGAMALHHLESEALSSGDALANILLGAMSAMFRGASVSEAQNVQDRYYSNVREVMKLLPVLTSMEMESAALNPVVVWSINRVFLALVGDAWKCFSDVSENAREFDVDMSSHSLSDGIFSAFSSVPDAPGPVVVSQLHRQVQYTQAVLENQVSLKESMKGDALPHLPSDLREQLHQLTDLALCIYKFALHHDSWRGSKVAAYQEARHRLLSPLLALGMHDLVRILAVKHDDFETLIEVYMWGEDGRGVPAELLGQMKRYRSIGNEQFCTRVFSYFVSRGRYRELLTCFDEFGEDLDRFISQHDGEWNQQYSWMQHIRRDDGFGMAAASLLDGARGEFDSIAERKTMLCLSKLAAIAGNDNNVKRGAMNGLDRVQYQEHIAPSERRALTMAELLERACTNAMTMQRNPGRHEQAKGEFRMALGLIIETCDLHGDKDEVHQLLRGLWGYVVAFDEWNELARKVLVGSARLIEPLLQQTVTQQLAFELLQNREIPQWVKESAVNSIEQQFHGQLDSDRALPPNYADVTGACLNELRAYV